MAKAFHARASVGFAVPGSLATISGGYEYARRVLALTGFRHLALPDGFPEPDAAALEGCAVQLQAWEGPLLIDGLAYGAFPETLAEAVGPRSVVLLHHPLDRECDVSEPEAAARHHREKAALAHARGVVATSAATARDLAARFDVSAERCAVAEPGVDPAPRSPARGDPPLLLSVGAVIPRKGHDLLVEALALLPEKAAYRLEIAGPTGRAPDYEAMLRSRVDAAGLSDRVVFLGPLPEDALEAAYRRADVAVLPSRYEGFGMAATEAIARGLPLIAGRGGALGETASAGLLVDVEKREPFASALEMLICDRAARAEAAERSWDAAQKLPRWEETARRVEGALKRFFADL